MFWQVGGASLVAIGTWVFIDGSSFIKFLVPFMTNYTKHANVPVFFICLGSVMVLLGILGCCGAQKESKCLLIMVNLIPFILH